MVNLKLTNEEAIAIRQGLKSALSFWDTYYMFAPGKDLNTGNEKQDFGRRAMAYNVIREIDNQLGE